MPFRRTFCRTHPFQTDFYCQSTERNEFGVRLNVDSIPGNPKKSPTSKMWQDRTGDEYRFINTVSLVDFRIPRL